MPGDYLDNNEDLRDVKSDFEAILSRDAPAGNGLGRGNSRQAENEHQFSPIYHNEKIENNAGESKRAQFSAYSCSYNYSTQNVESDDVRLSFSDFYDLMSNKIVN